MPWPTMLPTSLSILVAVRALEGGLLAPTSPSEESVIKSEPAGQGIVLRHSWSSQGLRNPHECSLRKIVHGPTPSGFGNKSRAAAQVSQFAMVRNGVEIRGDHTAVAFGGPARMIP